MPIPNLIHPVKITFELQNVSDTVYDTQAREPVRQVTRSTTVIIKGQASLYFAGAKLDYPMYERMGVVEESNEYVALRFKDMIKQGLMSENVDGSYSFVLKRGDRVIRIGRRNVNFFVMGFKDFAHYPELAQTMIQVNLSDRHPSAQNGDL